MPRRKPAVAWPAAFSLVGLCLYVVTLLVATTQGGLADYDDDNVLDSMDNCPLIANPGQEDEEGDGIGDVCELDVDCNGVLGIGDALMILHYIVGWADLHPDECPLPQGSLNGPRASAYAPYPGGGTIVDGVMILQCIVGRNNIVCPAS